MHSRSHAAEPAKAIPDPSTRFVRALAAHAFEVVEGIRSIAQLGPAISVTAARQLAEQRAALRERQQAFVDARRCAPSPGPAHMCRVEAHVVEAAVVMHTIRRSYSVSMRLEWAHRRWRACDVFVL